MEVGLFQLLPRGCAGSDAQVVEQALWEVDFAERHNFESIWITEHHFSGYGSIGAPSVYAAGIAQRTRRIRIGYGVAVVPLHHPLRLAEEIAWVDHLSQGRLLVGFGPGFSPFEFAAFDVPVAERHVRCVEGVNLVRRALSEPEITYKGNRYTIRPRPFTTPHPRFYWASTADESLRKAGAEGMALLFGLEPFAEIAERLDRYRAIRAAAGTTSAVIDQEIAQMYVLRRICIADTDDQALHDVQDPLRYHREMGVAVHEHLRPVVAIPAEERGAREISNSQDSDAENRCSNQPPLYGIGSPATVIRHFEELHALGIRKVIAWFHFGNIRHSIVRRSMQLMAKSGMLR
jgi:alkanesulfonate monooxygenase SsuD/methylene tetrahydromethanopterin reductase-like flavin-dependent oxidoreductase (luciferase family)